MVKNITLIGARLSTNFGGPSLLVSTRQVLSQFFPDAEFTLYVPVSSYKSDLQLAEKYGIKILPFYTTKWLIVSAIVRRCTGVLIGSPAVKEMITALEKTDVVIDIWGIIFADQAVSKTFRSSLFRGLRFVLSKILGKTAIKYTSDLGPFNYKLNRISAKLYLGHFVDIILARDEETRRCVEELRIRTPVLTVPDTAFLLPHCKSKKSEMYAELRKKSPLIGLSVSFQAKNRAENSDIYVTVMKGFIRHLIDRYGATVIVIPNELSKTAVDDAQIAKEICSDIADERCQMLYIDDLLAQEIKGIINQCDVIVAARYHTIVAALSSGIPTIAIGWHHKYEGVLRFFKQERCLCDIKSLELEDLIGKFEYVWNNREMIRETILSYIPEINEKIISGAEEVQKLLHKKLCDKV